MLVRYIPNWALRQSSLCPTSDGDARGAFREHRDLPRGGRDAPRMLLLVIVAAVLAVGFFGVRPAILFSSVLAQAIRDLDEGHSPPVAIFRHWLDLYDV